MLTAQSPDEKRLQEAAGSPGVHSVFQVSNEHGFLGSGTCIHSFCPECPFWTSPSSVMSLLGSLPCSPTVSHRLPWVSSARCSQMCSFHPGREFCLLLGLCPQIAYKLPEGRRPPPLLLSWCLVQCLELRTRLPNEWAQERRATHQDVESRGRRR